MKAIKKIAIRIPNWIGDAVFSLSLIRLVRIVFNKASIYLIMRKSVKEVFSNNPDYNEIILINDKQELFKTGIHLKKYHFDLYINLPESLSAHLISYLSGSIIRLGFKRDFGWLFNQFSLPKNKLIIHRSQKYFNLIKYFLQKKGITSPRTVLNEAKIYLTSNEIKHAKMFLKKYKLKKVLIGINPNCSSESRRWLESRFAQLSDILISNKNISVIFFGSKLEKGYVDEIIKLTKIKPLNLAGLTTLREYCGILSLLNVFVTNDSGPMHLANAVGTNVIALEGPADIRETGMLNKKAKFIYINKNIECSPCVKNVCPINKECMFAITVKDVIQALKKFKIPL